MTKGCYTCRRRRIICDNGQPTCRKCRDAGKECLGYQKPLVWVKGGVASRGKMMGRSFEDMMGPAHEKSALQTEMERASTTAAVNVGFGGASVAESSFDAGLHSSGNASSVADAGTATEEPEELDTSLIHVPRSTRAEYIPAPWGLVDPLFKDLGQFSRFYLFHCMCSIYTRQF